MMISPIKVQIHNKSWKPRLATWRRPKHVLFSMNNIGNDSVDLEAYKLLAEKVGKRLTVELTEVGACASLMLQYATKKEADVKPEDIILLCDSIDEVQSKEKRDLFVEKGLNLRYEALKFARHSLLVKLMKNQYDAYVATASFLSPSRIDRWDLPNVQDVPVDNLSTSSLSDS
jgi:hypothetical protein